jgi:hypothetical protein
MHSRNDPSFKAICNAAHKRVVAVLRCLDILVPDATPRQKKRIANKILTLCDGKDRSVKITQTQTQDLIMPHTCNVFGRTALSFAFGNRFRGR